MLVGGFLYKGRDHVVVVRHVGSRINKLGEVLLLTLAPRLS